MIGRGDSGPLELHTPGRLPLLTKVLRMCLVAVFFSLIPVLSGYALYLTVAVALEQGSPAVQGTLAGVLLVALVLVGVQLLRRVRQRRSTRVEEGVVVRAPAVSDDHPKS